MSETARPAVEVKTPPEAVLRIMNPIIVRVLRSPLHRVFSKGLMLLHVTGRRSGRVYVVPVGRHELDGRLVTSAGGRWRQNLRHGAELEVTLDGRRQRAHGELVEDPDEVAQVFSDLLAREGLKKASMMGLKLNVDRAPTLEELRAALTDRKVLRLSLEG
jgi:hypothetical protein